MTEITERRFGSFRHRPKPIEAEIPRKHPNARSGGAAESIRKKPKSRGEACRMFPARRRKWPRAGGGRHVGSRWALRKRGREAAPFPSSLPPPLPSPPRSPHAAGLAPPRSLSEARALDARAALPPIAIVGGGGGGGAPCRAAAAAPCPPSARGTRSRWGTGGS